MNLLITGASGFVGFNLLLQALRDPRIQSLGAAVRNPEKLRKLLAGEGFSEFPARLQVIEGSSSSWNILAKRSQWSPDACVHCAGVLFAHNSGDYYTGNVGGTLGLLKELPDSCRVIVLSSQSAAGPTPTGRPFRDESDPETPLSEYGKSKWEMEKRVRKNAGQRPLVILRPPTVLGPHDAATLPIFQMVRLPFWIKPGIPEKHLSWISAGDLSRAILEAVFHKDARGTFFVSGSNPTTDLQLLHTAAKIMGTKGRILRVPAQILKCLSGISSLIPALGKAVPSLMPDRVLELMYDNWLISGDAFQSQFAWEAKDSLRDSLLAAATSYENRGILPRISQ